VHGFSSILFAVCCVGNELCDGLITLSEEFYQARACVCVSIVCDLETSTLRWPRPVLGSCATKRYVSLPGEQKAAKDNHEYPLI
jgi:hypothetical protein